MLSIKTYPKEYILRCKTKIENDLDLFRLLNLGAPEFEICYFNNMVLVLETMFIHRMRGKEGKDGNPLNEVRMLANSILNNNSKMKIDKTIKYNQNGSILKIKIDQLIEITSNEFEKLSEAYFKEISKKYLE